MLHNLIWIESHPKLLVYDFIDLTSTDVNIIRLYNTEL